MKYITFDNFKNLCKVYINYIDEQKNPYTYLYKSINGFAYGTRGKSIINRNIKLRLTSDDIKVCWDNTELYKQVAKLAIYIHYEGHIIQTSRAEKRLITNEYINSVVKSIKHKLEETYDEVSESVA